MGWTLGEVDHGRDDEESDGGADRDAPHPSTAN
jgi:hypothetical protein